MEAGGVTSAEPGLAVLQSAAGLRRTNDQQSFSAVLSRAKPGETAEERARTGAEQLVSTALVQPVLKSLRESNNAAPPFAPNQAERSFRSLMDASLAQRMVHSQHWGLVDRLARSLLAKSGHGTTSVRQSPHA
jgi:Rod binding domain-containing protein